MKKLSTNIEGLDELFLGGIQVTSVTKKHKRDSLDNEYQISPLTNNVDDKRKIIDAHSIDDRLRDSLVIVIRGDRGIHKHLFAMQLMHGLGRSICEYAYNNNNERIKTNFVNGSNKDYKSLMYYSINKPTHLLDDMYLDLLIERWITYTNIYYKELYLQNPHSVYTNPNIALLNKLTTQILRSLFRITGDNIRCIQDMICDKNITAQLIADNIIGYNARTNSIHIKSFGKNDDEDNLLFNRRYDRIGDYYNDQMRYRNSIIAELNRQITNELNGQNSNCMYFDTRKEFLNVLFNNHLSHSNSNQNYNSVRNAHSARMNFMSILNDISTILDVSDSRYPATNKPFVSEVTVIDGFSHISEKDLQTLPYNHLIDCLRKLSRISILVFEDTQKTIPDGDIEIEIRSNYDESEDYSFNELRIAKCVNQVTAIGWHLYKRQESRIRIYPSLHLNLFKRSYINNQLHEAGKSILADNYDTFVASINNQQNFN